MSFSVWFSHAHITSYHCEHAHKHWFDLFFWSNLSLLPCRQVCLVLTLLKSCTLAGIFMTFCHSHCLFSSSHDGIPLFYTVYMQFIHSKSCWQFYDNNWVQDSADLNFLYYLLARLMSTVCEDYTELGLIVWTSKQWSMITGSFQLQAIIIFFSKCVQDQLTGSKYDAVHYKWLHAM